MRYSHHMTTPTREPDREGRRGPRQRLNITKGVLAQRVGVSDATLSNRLAGRRRLDTEQLDSLALALGFESGFSFIAYAKAMEVEAA